MLVPGSVYRDSIFQVSAPLLHQIFASWIPGCRGPRVTEPQTKGRTRDFLTLEGLLGCLLGCPCPTLLEVFLKSRVKNISTPLLVLLVLLVWGNSHTPGVPSGPKV